jgi:hypothetical protein
MATNKKSSDNSKEIIAATRKRASDSRRLCHDSEAMLEFSRTLIEDAKQRSAKLQTSTREQDCPAGHRMVVVYLANSPEKPQDVPCLICGIKTRMIVGRLLDKNELTET